MKIHLDQMTRDGVKCMVRNQVTYSTIISSRFSIREFQLLNILGKAGVGHANENVRSLCCKHRHQIQIWTTAEEVILQLLNTFSDEFP